MGGEGEAGDAGRFLEMKVTYLTVCCAKNFKYADTQKVSAYLNIWVFPSEKVRVPFSKQSVHYLTHKRRNILKIGRGRRLRRPVLKIYNKIPTTL